MIFAVIPHMFGSGACLVKGCRKTYHKDSLIMPASLSEIMLVGSLGSIPVLGGIYFLAINIQSFLQEKHPFLKKINTFLLIRGFLSVLGLGIVFLLIDIIFTIGVLIKETCCNLE